MAKQIKNNYSFLTQKSDVYRNAVKSAISNGGLPSELLPHNKNTRMLNR